MSAETLTSLMKLPTEVLRLRLSGANLDMSGSKKQRATRLYHHLRSRPLPDQRRRRTDQRQRSQEDARNVEQPTPQDTEESSSGTSDGDTEGAPAGSSSGTNQDSDSEGIDDDDRAVLRRHTCPLTDGQRPDPLASSRNGSSI